MACGIGDRTEDDSIHTQTFAAPGTENMKLEMARFLKDRGQDGTLHDSDLPS